MDSFKELYMKGMTFNKYVQTREKIDKEKHLYYVEKIEINNEQKKAIQAIDEVVELLVFCEVHCNDCRVTLAVLENINTLNKKIQFRIVNREGNIDIMETFGKGHRIPMIILLNHQPTIIFNEFHEALISRMAKASIEEKESLKQQYRKGIFKDDIVNQLLKYLESI